MSESRVLEFPFVAKAQEKTGEVIDFKKIKVEFGNAKVATAILLEKAEGKYFNDDGSLNDEGKKAANVKAFLKGAHEVFETFSDIQEKIAKLKVKKDEREEEDATRDLMGQPPLKKKLADPKTQYPTGISKKAELDEVSEKVVIFDTLIRSFLVPYADAGLISDDQIREVFGEEMLRTVKEITSPTETPLEESAKKENLAGDIRSDLAKAEARPEYSVSETSDPVEETMKPIWEKWKEYARDAPPTEAQKLKEEITVVFYKIYRNFILSKLEEYETIEMNFGGIKWEVVLQGKAQVGMKNLIADLSGFNPDRYQAQKKKFEDTGRSFSPEDIYTAMTGVKKLGASEQLYIDLMEDYWAFNTEYTARKFIILTWSSYNEEMLPGSGVREYPQKSDGSAAPSILTANSFIRNGLTKERFGKLTNQIIETRTALVKSHKEYGKRERLTYEATVTGETMRALDRWARGKLILGSATTQNIHSTEDILAKELAKYLNRRHKEKFGHDAGTPYSPDQTIRTWRFWATLTFHQSARAVVSAAGADNIYYMHKMHEYNVSNAVAGTDPWYPLVTMMLFTRRDPDTGEKFNPLAVLLDESNAPEMAHSPSKRSRIDSFNPSLKRMIKAMASKGYEGRKFLEYSEERFKREGFEDYGFLLESLLTMPDYAQQSEAWEEIEIDGKLVRKRVSELKKNVKTGEVKERRPGERLTGGWAEVDPGREDFAVQPVLGTLFLRHEPTGGEKFGKVKTFPAPPGEDTIGRPITFLDYQDEWGEIIYEKLDFSADKSAEEYWGSVTSLSRNGGNFLKKFLKSEKILDMLADPIEVAELKKDLKYVMRHLPSYGALYAAELYDKVEDKLYEGLMGSLIAQLVFVGVIIKTDIAKEDHWGLPDVKKYLSKLTAGSRAVSHETAEAIYTAIEAAQGLSLSVSKVMHVILERLKERQKYTIGSKH